MAAKQNTSHNHFPWSHIVGFVLSIVLTIVALWFALHTNFSVKAKLIIIFIFAFLQAVLQLLMFMHIKEGSKGIQTGTMIYAAFIAITVAAGSVWVMAMPGMYHDMPMDKKKHNSHERHEKHNMEHNGHNMSDMDMGSNK